MVCKLRKMSARGDETVQEWDTETVSLDKLREIEREFEQYTERGYFAANLDTQEIIKEFNPGANILLMPKMVGGSGFVRVCQYWYQYQDRYRYWFL